MIKSAVITAVLLLMGPQAVAAVQGLYMPYTYCQGETLGAPAALGVEGDATIGTRAVRLGAEGLGEGAGAAEQAALNNAPAATRAPSPLGSRRCRKIR